MGGIGSATDNPAAVTCDAKICSGTSATHSALAKGDGPVTSGTSTLKAPPAASRPGAVVEGPSAPSKSIARFLDNTGSAAVMDRTRMLAPSAASTAPVHSALGRGLVELLRLSRLGTAKLPALPDLPYVWRGLPVEAFRGPDFPGPDAPGASRRFTDPLGQVKGRLEWTTVPYEFNGLKLEIVYQQGNDRVPRYIIAPLAGGARMALKISNNDRIARVPVGGEHVHVPLLQGELDGVLLINALGADIEVKADAKVDIRPYVKAEVAAMVKTIKAEAKADPKANAKAIISAKIAANVKVDPKDVIVELMPSAYSLTLPKITFFIDGAMAYGSSMYTRRYDRGRVPAVASEALAAWLEGKKDLTVLVKRQGKSSPWTFDKKTLAPGKGCQIPAKI